MVSGPGLDESASWFYDYERDAVTGAFYKLQRRVFGQVAPGMVVAELHMGFWTGLLSGHYVAPHTDYDDAIWFKGGVRNRFGGMKRKIVHKRLNRLRDFRNRIAHHEHLLNVNLDVMSADIETLLSKLDPAVDLWVRAMSEVKRVRAKRPY